MEKKSKAWQKFIELCLEAENKSILSNLFDLLFTPEEKQDLGMRLSIVHALIKGNKTQREISRDLKVSIAKITRGSNALKSIDRKLENFLQEKILLK